MTEGQFDQGKQLLIEGLEELYKIYCPPLRMIEAFDLMGLSGLWPDADGIRTLKTELDMVLDSLRRAETPDEMRKVIQGAKSFFNLPKSEEERS